MFQKFQHDVITWCSKEMGFSERTEFNNGKSSSTPRTTEFNDENTGPFLYPVHYTMSFRSPRWNMTTKCRSCSVILPTMSISKMRRHYGFLPLKLSSILLALVIDKGTCYWHQVSNSVSRWHQSIRLSNRHIRPTCCYTIVSWSNFPDRHSRVFWWKLKILKASVISQIPRTRVMRRWGIWEVSWMSEGVNLYNLDCISCSRLTKSMSHLRMNSFHITLAPPKAASSQHILLEQRRLWSAGDG